MPGALPDYGHRRTLVPSVMRSVLLECSRKKIEEIEMENTILKGVFTKLRNLPPEKRQVPFAREDINLQSDEIKTLEDNGVVLHSGDEYYIPEIFHLGLGFKRKFGARHTQLLLARGIGSLITQYSTFTHGQTITLAPSGRGRGWRWVMGT